MKIYNLGDIKELRCGTVVTVGMFDGVHAGHRHLLSSLLSSAQCRELEPVVVTFDRHPRLVVNADESMRLLSTYDERLHILESCGVENLVIVRFDRETAEMSACEFTRKVLVPRLGMKVLLLGYDNMFGSRRENDFDQLPLLSEEYGFEICRDDAVVVDGVTVSSTKIRAALIRGEMSVANAMLGALYSVSGVVVHGRHVGRSLGFPTANVVPDDRLKMMPKAGVYALKAYYGDRMYKAMANLGTQPTFHNDYPVLEVHLLDFEGDLYGKRIIVEFVERLRDTVEFGSVEELSSQLAEDQRNVEQIIM